MAVERVWFEAFLLCFINLINYMDRFTVSGVLTDIEKEFHMDQEWQGGLLQTAFIICYFASAPIFGYLGDRYSRKYLMIFGIIAWTGCTLAASFMPVSIHREGIKDLRSLISDHDPDHFFSLS